MVRSKTTESAPKAVRQTWEKDEEELELEQQLFGQRKKRRIAKKRDVGYGDEEDTGLKDVEDHAIFTIDAPIAGGSRAQSVSDIDADSDQEAGAASDDDEGSEEDEGDESGSSGSRSEEDDEEEAVGDEASDGEVDIIIPDDQYDVEAEAAEREEAAARAQVKKSVWKDASDDLIGLDLAEVKRLKKLARGKPNSKVGGAELEKRLREQFERIHPRPEWANGRIRSGVPSLSSLFSSTKSFIDSGNANGKARPPLPQGVIEIQRLRNANQTNPTTGKREAQGGGSGVVDFVWHPSPRVPVGVVCGGDRRIRFFNIDGHANPTLLTLHIPALPLTKTTFHPSGSSLLITGTRPYYYTYDLASQKCLRSPRNLFGSSPSASAPQSLTTHAFSPDGSLLAVAGRRGAVSILDWSSTGTGAVVAELKGGRGGKTADIVWGADGKELEILGGRDGAEVEVWDVGERKIVRKWADDRAYGGEIMRRSRGGEYTAIGSSTGIINLYASSSLTKSKSKSHDASTIPNLKPEPIKSLEHITTSICTMDFHPSGEMMVGASTGKKDALKMYHLPSATAFANWPTQTTSLGRVTTAKFSTSGEYLAVGNQKGNVLLWSLKHFSR